MNDRRTTDVTGKPKSRSQAVNFQNAVNSLSADDAIQLTRSDGQAQEVGVGDVDALIGITRGKPSLMQVSVAGVVLQHVEVSGGWSNGSALPGATGSYSASLKFDDGSKTILDWDSVRILDSGPALLEPITVDEYRGVERVLDELWLAIDTGELGDHHRLQLRAMYDVLFEDHRSTEPDETKRHRLVGTMRSVALFSNHEGIRAGFAWWKIAEVLTDINWHSIAAIFP